jgi:hypothetical protein
MIFGLFAGEIITVSWRLFYAFVAAFGVGKPISILLNVP